MRRTAVLLTVIAIAAPAAMRAQETGSDVTKTTAQPAEHFYKLNLVVEQINEAAKVVNARTYTATVQTNANYGRQSIRTGDRVPVSTGANQFQYIDMGVDFDISQVKENGRNLSFRLGADLSSFAMPPRTSTEEESSGSTPSSSHPVIRQNKWDSTVLIPIGKATVVFSADDLNDKGKVQVEVTATRID